MVTLFVLAARSDESLYQPLPKQMILGQLKKSSIELVSIELEASNVLDSYFAHVFRKGAR
jgi:hypothetical protein